MDYAYKVTTHGRTVMAACMAMEKPLKITRVAFGSGLIEEDVNPADVHELLAFVSNGAVAERRHENERLFLTIQYANGAHLDIKKMFYIAEFMVYTENPESGAETDLLYGTLGDYRQPVPAFNPSFPSSVFNFPLVLVISDEVNVEVSAPAGLVTYEDLAKLTQELAIRQMSLTIPANGWVPDAVGRYLLRRDVPVIGVTDKMVPNLTVLHNGEETAAACGLAPFAETMEDAIRLRAVTAPASEIPASLILLRDSTGIVISNCGGGAVGELPLATDTTPGAVKPGRGLLVDTDGTLNVDMAEDSELDKLLDGNGEGV